MKTVVILLITLSLAVLYAAFNITQRHDYCTTAKLSLCVATHIKFPGFEMRFYPEHTVELEKWIGTEDPNHIVIDKETGKKDREATAGMALLNLNFFGEGYQLIKRKDGHCVLHRSEKREKYFTWSAFYRIGPWQHDPTI